MRLSKRVLITLAIALPTLVAVIVALVVGFAVRGAAAAPHGRTLYVGSSAGTNASCASPGYISVQAAVSAASSGDTVHVCAGTYVEPVVVADKSLSLVGDSGATIAAPGTWPTVGNLPPQFGTDNLIAPRALVLVWGASANVTISNLTVSGPFPSDRGCYPQEFGVLVLSGATVALNGDSVLNVRDSDSSLWGCQHGVGIQVGREYWPDQSYSFLVENFVGHASISGTTVHGHQKNGITVDGPGSTVDVRDTTVQGDGRVNYTAQNGIQISRGATGSVRTSSISDQAYTGPYFASGAGILVYGGCGDPLDVGVQLVNNTLTNNDVGVYMNNYSADCTGAATTPTLGKVTNNVITDDALTNYCPFGYSGCFGYVTYQVGIDDIGNGDKLDGNKISGIGYVNAANDPSSGVYILPIDNGVSFPNANAKVHGNQVR